MRATHADATLRDGQKAVEFATRACELTQWQSLVAVQALAAAYAEANDFPSAIKWQQQVLELSSEDEKEGAQARLSKFQSSQPHRE